VRGRRKVLALQQWCIDSSRQHTIAEKLNKSAIVQRVYARNISPVTY
jgi:hypothetical protein